MKLPSVITMAWAAVMKAKPQRRYVVYADDGQAIRKFYTKQDAVRFLQEGWRIVTLPVVPVIDWNNYEPALF